MAQRKRKPGFYQNDRRALAKQAVLRHKELEELKAHSGLRLMADGKFTPEELAALTEKIRGYQASHVARVGAS